MARVLDAVTQGTTTSVSDRMSGTLQDAANSAAAPVTDVPPAAALRKSAIGPFWPRSSSRSRTSGSPPAWSRSAAAATAAASSSMTFAIDTPFPSRRSRRATFQAQSFSASVTASPRLPSDNTVARSPRISRSIFCEGFITKAYHTIIFVYGHKRTDTDRRLTPMATNPGGTHPLTRRGVRTVWVEITGGGEVRSWPRSASPARTRRNGDTPSNLKISVPGMPRSGRPVAAALRPQARVGVVRDRVELRLVTRGLVDDVARADHRGP